MRSIYLDYNASTPLAPCAQEAMLPYLADRFADPHAEHAPGRAVYQAIEDARTVVAQSIGASASEVVWTSGATESCNLALHGLLGQHLRNGRTPHVIVSSVDHAAVQGPVRYLESIGAEATVVPCDHDGVIAPDSVLDALRPNTRLVSVVHANDEVGAVQPIQEIAALCHDEGVLVHTDAAQSFGKLRVSVEELGVDLLSLSAHKAYGPKGCGALYVRSGIGLEPMLQGDPHEGGLRAGMPNVAGVVGFAAAARLAATSLEEAAPRLASLRDRLETGLLNKVGDGRVYGPTTDDRLPNTLCIALPGVAASDLLTAVPELSATACASVAPGMGEHGVSLSSTLRSIEALPAEAAGAIRLSVGWYTSEDDIAQAADALAEAWRQTV